MNLNGTLNVMAISILTAGQINAAMLAGSKPKDWPANPANHQISINRKAAEDKGKRMIEIAENTKPDTGVWWMQKEGKPVLTCGVKTPYAITKDALDYYDTLIKGFQKKVWHGYSEPKSSLVYTATATHEDDFVLNGKAFKNVYVVNMELKVTLAHVTEKSGGTFIIKKRTVVLNSEGVPQEISGDEDKTFPVWMN